MSTFFPALVGLVVLEIRVLFTDSIDDSMIRFPFLSYFCYVAQNTYMFPTVVIWRVFVTICICNDAIFCYFFFFIYNYCDNMMLILYIFLLHTHESMLQLFLL